MKWLKQLFWRRRLYGDLTEEIREHLDEKVEELVRGGVSRKEAGAAARRAFGNVTLTEEDSRSVWRWPSVEELLADVRYGLRAPPQPDVYRCGVADEHATSRHDARRASIRW